MADATTTMTRILSGQTRFFTDLRFSRPALSTNQAPANLSWSHPNQRRRPDHHRADKFVATIQPRGGVFLPAVGPRHTSAGGTLPLLWQNDLPNRSSKLADVPRVRPIAWPKSYGTTPVHTVDYVDSRTCYVSRASGSLPYPIRP